MNIKTSVELVRQAIRDHGNIKGQLQYINDVGFKEIHEGLIRIGSYSFEVSPHAMTEIDAIIRNDLRTRLDDVSKFLDQVKIELPQPSG